MAHKHNSIHTWYLSNESYFPCRNRHCSASVPLVLAQYHQHTEVLGRHYKQRIAPSSYSQLRYLKNLQLIWRNTQEKIPMRISCHRSFDYEIEQQNKLKYKRIWSPFFKLKN